MKKTDIKSFNNQWYNPGASFVKRGLWYCINAVFFTSYFPFNNIKIFWLKMFGAEVGSGVVLKPSINIKYPWKLEIGNNVWIGEKVWIDNLAKATIGDNACISQGAMLLTGNHNYKKTSFDLMIGEIVLEEGVWVGAQAVICPNVICKSHSVISAGAIVTGNTEPYSIYSGNPAVKTKDRIIE